MFSPTQIKLKQGALQSNLDFIRQHLKEGVEISLVLKGNAYGHGIDKMVPMAEKCGARHFSVFSADEAKNVLDAAKNNPCVMIMGYVDEPSMRWAIEQGVEFFVFSMQRLQLAVDLAKELGTRARVHIEIETGMNRTGFDDAVMEELISTLKKENEHLYLAGCCTHFAGAESISNYVRIKQQQRVFKKQLNRLKREGFSFDKVHTCCSAAAVRYPEMHYNMVRIGIMTYGFWPSDEIYVEFANRTEIPGKDPLKPIISWKSSVMEIKSVKKGEFIGYGTSYLAHEDTVIAIVPVGYGYGFARSLSNTGRVLINGIRAGVVGTVMMNSIAVNITQIDNVNIGDEVVLIGSDGDNAISVASFSRFSDQLNYELLTRLPHNIPREII